MYSIRSYGEMIADRGRMQAYGKALREAITPRSVVLDIGTGTGIFALLACRLGARRVFAVEPSDAIVVAREIAAANGLAERIEFFQCASTQVALPERADVIVSDLRGILPLHGHHIAAVADARRRLLAPAGVMIPRSDTLWVAVIEAAQLHERVTTPWTHNDFGLDMEAGRRLVANAWCRAAVRSEQVIAGPACFGTLDYRHVEEPDLGARIRLRAARPTAAHGLCAWFDATLAEGVRFSNAPGQPGLVYGQAFFPWPQSVELAAGDEIDLELRAHLVEDDYVWSWETRVGKAQVAKAHFKQSEFFADPLSPAKLRKRSAGHVAELNEDARIDRLALALMDEAMPLGDVARELAARFPQRFARWQDALARVGELSARYSD